MDMSPLILAAIALALVAGAGGMAIYGRRHRISAFWGALALAFSGGAMVLCLVGTGLGTIYAAPTGDPQATADSFMLSLVQGDYDKAYSLLSGHSDLGLASQPQTQAGQLIYQALQESYDYSLNGQCQTELTHAVQGIKFRYLDVAAVTEGLHDRVQEQLKAMVGDRPSEQVYGDDGQYLPEVIQEAYTLALKEALSQAKASYVTIELELSLDYVDGQWLVNGSNELFNALTGGAGL